MKSGTGFRGVFLFSCRLYFSQNQIENAYTVTQEIRSPSFFFSIGIRQWRLMVLPLKKGGIMRRHSIWETLFGIIYFLFKVERTDYYD